MTFISVPRKSILLDISKETFQLRPYNAKGFVINLAKPFLVL